MCRFCSSIVFSFIGYYLKSKPTRLAIDRKAIFLLRVALETDLIYLQYNIHQ